jgi:hypothetical protein
MFRRDQLCPGPGECGFVLSENPFADASSDPCAECPRALLDEYLASPAGRVIGATIDLDFMLQAGVTVRLSDIPYPEFLFLRFLSEERNRYHEEQAKQAAERQRHGGK